MGTALHDTATRPLSAGAIGAGLVVDIGSTLALMVALAVLTTVSSAGARPEDVERALSSTGLLLAGVVTGLFSTLLGGYVSAVVAGQRQVEHGLIMGVLEAVLSVLLVFGAQDLAPSTPTWSSLVPIALTVPASCAGAWLRARRAGPTELHLVGVSVGTLAVTIAGALVVPRPTVPAAPPAPAPPAPIAAPAPPSARALAVRSLLPPLVDETVEGPRPSASEAAPVRLEGAPDTTYREGPPDGPRFGGDEAATEWRRAHELPAETLRGGGQVLIVGDRRRVALAASFYVHVVDAGRQEPLRFDVNDAVVSMALSGNRLLIATRSAIRVVDLDRGELLREKLQLSGATLAVCALEPRRAYADGWGITSVLDVGRLQVVAASAREVPVRNRGFTADGRGRFVYLFDHAGVIVQDPARGFEPVVTLTERTGALRADPAGRFVFSPAGVWRGGSLERVDAPGGELLGRLTDGSLLVSASGALERRDPLTARRLGEPLAARAARFHYGPALLAGTDRLVRLRVDVPPVLEVLDVPLEPAAPAAADPPRLEALPPPATAGVEWSYAPRVSDPAGAALRIEGPAGLTWDGTTARWRPTAEDVGATLITIVASVPGRPDEVLQEPVTVGLTRLAVDLPRHTTILTPRALPSGRLVVWRTRRDLGALDPASGRLHTVGLVGCTSFAEVGDSLWVAVDEGGLVELSCPELVPRSEVRIDGAAPVLVAALPDGRVGWADLPAPERLRVGRFRPGATTCEVVEGTWPPRSTGTPDALAWWDADRVFVSGGVLRFGPAALEPVDARYTGPVEGVLADGTVFTGQRIFRADGSLVREHPHGTGGAGPSHDGSHYLTLDHQPDRSWRASLRDVRKGAVLTSVPLPEHFYTALLASRASTVVGYRLETRSTPSVGPRTTCTFVLIPYALPRSR